MDGYLPRVLDREMADRLSRPGAILVEGARACGKTQTARRACASEVLLDVDIAAREAMTIDPELVLDGEMPRLIDEWQIAPEVFNHVRRWVDDGRGRFVLTGSSVPSDDDTRHTGAGRVSRLRMRPLSLFEAGRSNGAISLSALLRGELAPTPDPGLRIDDITDAICRGGWPALRDLPVTDAAAAVRDYLAEVERADVSRVDGIRRDPERVRQLLRSLARNVATRVAAATLARDAGLTADTTAGYLRALSRVMVYEEQPAWRPHLRSRVDLRTTPVRHFVDPSLAAAALGAGPDALRRDVNWLGLLFESLVVRDLRVYAQPFRGRVTQYRDNKDLEVDAVVETDDGAWAAFEIKLGSGRIDEGASALLRFKAKVDADRMGEPAVLGVIVGTGYGYVRPDGVAVIPIGALGP